MHAIKSFIDGRGRRVRAGQPLATDYDAATLAHYLRLGMVAAAGQAQAPAQSPAQALARPAHTKPAGPAQRRRAPRASSAPPASLLADVLADVPAAPLHQAPPVAADGPLFGGELDGAAAACD